MKKLFVGAGGLRPLWRAAIILVTGWLLCLGVALGLGALMNQLYAVWGVNQRTIARAPDWIRLISGHWGEWVAIVQNALLWPLAALLCPLLGGGKLRRGKWGAGGLAAGALTALAVGGPLMLMDGLRMGRPLNAPLMTGELFIPLAMYLLASVGVEALLRGALSQNLAPWPALARWALGAAAFAALTAPSYDPATLINLFLMGLLLAMGAEKTGGYLAGALARFSLYAVVYVVMGCAGGASVAVYECYPAAHDLLSGAYRGPLGGLWATCLLAGMAVLGLYKLRWRTQKR